MFISQCTTIEQPQEQYLIDDYLSTRDSANPLCAWCLSEQGLAFGEGSHGICQEHANSFLSQWKEHRSRHIKTSA